MKNFFEFFAHENANFLQNAIFSIDEILHFRAEKLPPEILKKIEFACVNLNFAKDFSRGFLRNKNFTPNLKSQNTAEFFQFLEKVATQICGENLIFKNLLPPKFKTKFDSILLLQIFLNLFLNAKNHGAKNSEINFVVEIKNKKVRAEIRNKICDKKKRAEKKVMNNGLKPIVHGDAHGLKICEKIAEKIGANFRWKNLDGKFIAEIEF